MSRNPATRHPVEAVLYRIPDAVAALGTSKKTIYRLIKDGEIEAVRLGADWRVVPESLVAYRERLRAEQRRPTLKRATRQVVSRNNNVITLRS